MERGNIHRSDIPPIFLKMQNRKLKIEKSILAVYWQDAAYSYLAKLPKEKPYLDHITFGVLLKKNSNEIIIGMNCRYNKKTKKILKCIDAFEIPIKTIQKIEEIGFLN